MLLTFHLPRGHGTYLKANETYRYFSLLIASDEFLRIHFLRLESQSDLRQRYFQKSYLNDRRQKAQTRHISLYDENSARFRRNDCKGRGSRFYGEPVIVNKNFNAVSVLNLLDVLAWGIDAATGAITKPEFKFYQIDFSRTGKKTTDPQGK